jgi:hypothetical protein
MTTTRHFQKLPDTYTHPTLHPRKRPNTNRRYSHFCQTHFTAGDEEQFEQYRNRTPLPPSTQKGECDPTLDIWSGYNALDYPDIKNTFKYLFYKLKKGCFVQIRNNALTVFLPFSNVHYNNEWSSEDTYWWYANNYLVRTEYPPIENDTSYPQIKHMFETLCAERSVPDLEVFVNKRDFLVLKRNRTEPYDALWPNETPLKSHSYGKYAPILSFSQHPDFADIAIPTADDWSRVMRPKIHFATSKRDVYKKEQDYQRTWGYKKDMAVFRGTSTGHLLSLDNPRVYVAWLSTQPEADGLLDAGITQWNLRPRMIDGELVTPDPSTWPVTLVPALTYAEQSTFKYVVHIQGHVAAYRLSVLLSFGSVVLMVECPYKMWFERFLEPYVHYVPTTLNTLLETIRWCREHDSECRQIAARAMAFHKEHLGKEAILTSLQKTLWTIKERVGFYQYPPKRLSEYQYRRSMACVTNYVHKFPRNARCARDNNSRNYLNFIEWSSHVRWPSTTDVVRQNSKSVVRHARVRGRDIVLKQSRQSVHEAFVGLFGVNPILRLIPNFAYTHGWMHNEVCVEYVPGQTFYDYLKGPTFRFDEYIHLLMQLSLSLGVAQRTCFFNHNDLCPWNVILLPVKHRLLDYLLDVGALYRVETDLIPVMIDFDMSHIVYRNESVQQSQSFSSYTDCITLLVSSLHLVCVHQQLTQQEQSKVMELVGYTLHDPVYCRATTFEELRLFLKRAHTFSQLQSAEKGDLLHYTPLHLFSSLWRLYLPCSRYYRQVHHLDYTNEGCLEGRMEPLPPPRSLLDVYISVRSASLLKLPLPYPPRHLTYIQFPVLETSEGPLMTDDECRAMSPCSVPMAYLETLNALIELLVLVKWSPEQYNQLVEEYKDVLYDRPTFIRYANQRAFFALMR